MLFLLSLKRKYLVAIISLKLSLSRAYLNMIARSQHVVYCPSTNRPEAFLKFESNAPIERALSFIIFANDSSEPPICVPIV